MNLATLNYVCQKETRTAYDLFKHYIDNAIFELSENIVSIHIKDLVQDIGMGVAKWYMKNHSYTDLQYKAVIQVKTRYIDIALKHAYKYVYKKMIQ